MRKNRFLLVLVILVMACALVFGLVACKPKPTPTPPPHIDTAAERVEKNFKEVINKITGSFTGVYPGGEEFFIDAKVALEYREKDADGNVKTGLDKNDNDLRLELVAKANAKLNVKGTDKDNMFLLEFKETLTNTPIIQLYFETQGGEGITEGSYIYVSLFGSDVFKTNAFSIYKLISILNPDLLKPVAAAAFDISSIGVLLFSDAKKVGNNYDFTMNLNELWNTISAFLENPSSLGDIIPGFDLGSILTGVDDIIAALNLDWTYKNDEGVDTKVTSIATFVKYIDSVIPDFTANTIFQFNESNHFLGANVKVDAAKKADVTNGFVLKCDVEPFTVTPGHLSADQILEGSFIKDKYNNLADRFTAESINILNFNIDVPFNINYVDGVEYAPVREMELRIDMNIDPFALIHFTKDASGNDVLTINKTAFMNLGYFNIEIQDKNADANGNKPFKLALAYNPEKTGSDYVSVFFQANLGSTGARDYLMTYYSISELLASITGNNSFIGTDPATTVAEGDTSTADLISTLFGVVKVLINNISIEGNAATIGIDTILTEIDKMFNLNLFQWPMIGSMRLVDVLFGYGVNSLTIGGEGATAAYGTAENIFDTLAWLEGMPSDKQNQNSGKSTIKPETVEYNGITTVEYGTPYLSLLKVNAADKNDKNYGVPVKFTTQAGEIITDEYMSLSKIIGYDPYKVGTQTVKFIVLPNSSLGAWLKMLLLPGDISIKDYTGAIAFETEITVKPAPQTVGYRIEGDNMFFTDGSKLFNIAGKDNWSVANQLGLKLIIDGKFVDLNDYMWALDEPSLNLLNGNITTAGNYSLTLSINGNAISVPISVAKLNLPTLKQGDTIADNWSIEYVDTYGVYHNQTLSIDDITTATAKDIANTTFNKNTLFPNGSLVSNKPLLLGCEATINFSIALDYLDRTVAISDFKFTIPMDKTEGAAFMFIPGTNLSWTQGAVIPGGLTKFVAYWNGTAKFQAFSFFYGKGTGMTESAYYWNANSNIIIPTITIKDSDGNIIANSNFFDNDGKIKANPGTYTISLGGKVTIKGFNLDENNVPQPIDFVGLDGNPFTTEFALKSGDTYTIKDNVSKIYTNQLAPKIVKTLYGQAKTEIDITSDMLADADKANLSTTGYVHFTKAGNYTLTFTLTDGTKITKSLKVVDLVRVVASPQAGLAATLKVGDNLLTKLIDAKAFKIASISAEGIYTVEDATSEDLAGITITTATDAMMGTSVIDENGIMTGLSQFNMYMVTLSNGVSFMIN